MSRVVPLIAFGIALVVGGFYWSLWNNSRSYLSDFVIQDEFYTLAMWIFRLLPIAIIFVGILCLIVAGVGFRKGVVSE